jgi:lysyl-tRNA synthetase class 2
MSELEQQIANRRAKRTALAEQQIAAYPHRFPVTDHPRELVAKFGDKTAAELEAEPAKARVPGRVLAARGQGKLSFVDLHDGHAKVQLFIRRDRLDDASRIVLEQLDLGDTLGAEGAVIRTRAGELSIEVERLTLLAKALRPLPEKWHGLTDTEARYRQRYVDLIVNEESRRVFETRAKIVAGIRAFLDARGYVEVETPMMHVIPTGAAARPFKTHHNALDLELYLRIAPELFLKRLVVGGLDRVYEINRNFRNEGLSTQHNPEFTMLEFYGAYEDYQSLMALTEEMITGLVGQLHGETTRLPWKDGEVSYARPWRRMSMSDAIVELGGVERAALASAASLLAEHRRRDLPLPLPGSPSATSLVEGTPDHDRWFGYLLASLFEATVEKRLLDPTFIHDYPTAISPLSKQKPDDPRFTERFELYIGGMEVANAFTELNDPDVQAQRFREQVEAREHGDAEAHPYDEDYIRALEYGLPPTGGEGVGIDRLTMLLTNRHSIRDVILFPLLRPQAP